MKISSASKKVVASALSAAMVVAFAPTAAFAAIDNGTDVKVTFDVNGGTITDTTIESLPSPTVKVKGGNLLIDKDTYKYAGLSNHSTDLTKDGATFKGWFVDMNDNQKFDDGTDVQYDAASGINVTGDAYSGEAITLYAMYNIADISTSRLQIPNTEAGKKAVDKLYINVTGDGIEAAKQYTAALTFPDGTQITAAKALTGTELAGESFAFAIDDTDAVKMTKGEYTYVVSELGGKFKVTKKVTLSEVKVDKGAGYRSFASDDVTSWLVSDNVKYSHLANLTVPTQPGSGNTSYAFDGYQVDGAKVTDAAGNGLSNLTGEQHLIKADTTLVATYANPKVFNVIVNTVAKKLSFDIEELPTNKKIERYDATVTGPNGFSKVISNVKNTTNGAITLSFGQKYPSDYGVTEELAAGTYTVSVAPVMKTGEILENNEKFTVDSASAELAAVTYDLNGGTWKKDDATKDAVKALPTVWQVGGTFDVSVVTVGANQIDPANDELDSFKEWQINGKAINGNNLTAADLKVAAAGVTVKAAWNTKAGAPAVTVAPNGAKYDLTVSAEAGRIVKYSTDDGTTWGVFPDNGKITVAANAVVKIKSANASNANADSAVATYYGVASDGSGVPALLANLTNIMNAPTSSSTTNKPVRYGDTLTTLKSDAAAAVNAIGFAKAKDWDKAVFEQYTKALDAVIGAETAEAEKLAEPVASADGKTYTYVNAQSIDQAKGYMADLKAAFAVNLGDEDTDNDIKTIKKFGTDFTNVNTWNEMKYIESVDDIVAGCAQIAKITVTAEDKTAADAVTAALKAANDAATAKAALDAYAALTDAQKGLVKADDVTAAQKVYAEATEAEKEAAEKEAAAKLVATQDLAAVKWVNNPKTKTVKLATAKKKATTITFKSKVSKSGHKVTYKKVSGSSKIKVYKTGSAKLAKVSKKGTYKAKVKVTCGKQTRNVWVKFFVK